MYTIINLMFIHDDSSQSMAQYQVTVGVDSDHLQWNGLFMKMNCKIYKR
jgi:hypothetical protein